MNIYVKEGYTLMGIMYAYEGRYNAIIYRNNVQDCVVCYNYDIEDGTWGHGTYVTTYEAAVKELKRHI